MHTLQFTVRLSNHSKYIRLGNNNLYIVVGNIMNKLFSISPIYIVSYFSAILLIAPITNTAVIR